MSHKQTVEEIYAAFGRGDIPAILDKLEDDVDWEYAYRKAPNPVPWLQARRGKKEVAGFFESLGALEFHNFAPGAILEGGNLVVALVNIDYTVKNTGKRLVETDEAHVWHFGSSGKISRFRHCADTYQNAMGIKK